MSSRDGYFAEDTVAALSSPTGGAIAILRLSGPLSLEIHQKLLGKRNFSPEPRKMVRSPLYSEKNELLDDAVSVVFLNPQSYTGEDLVEYHIHGNPFIAHRLLETLHFHGARQALPGEFSFRAVRNGKLDLFQAQAVADLIEAPNDGAIGLALEKLSKHSSQQLTDLADGLRKMAALSELGIDFADQDVDEVSLPRLKLNLQASIRLLENLEKSYSKGIRIQEGIRVALIGLPNAGKSSFFNALLGEDRSIVSDIVGTTRDVIREQFTLRGKRSTLTLRLEDTAGLRETHNPIEKSGIQRTVETARNAELVLWIIDPNQPATEVQEQWSALQGGDNPLLSQQKLANKTIGILSKSDSTSPLAQQKARETIASLGVQHQILTSAMTGNGIHEAGQTIADFCEKWVERRPGEMLITRLDHFRAIQEALGHLARAIQAPEIDLFASDLRQTLSSLGPLIGETLQEDLLNKIFSDFCIGK